MIGGAGGSGDPWQPGGSKGFFREGVDNVMGNELTAAESAKAQRIRSILHYTPPMSISRTVATPAEAALEQTRQWLQVNSLNAFRPPPVHGTYEVEDAHATYYHSTGGGATMWEINWDKYGPTLPVPNTYEAPTPPQEYVGWEKDDPPEDIEITDTPTASITPGLWQYNPRPRPGEVAEIDTTTGLMRVQMRAEPPGKQGCRMQ